MKKLFIALVVIIAITMASCSTGRYVGNSKNLNMNQTQVVLSEANFKVVKTVQTHVVFKQGMKFSAEQLQQSAYAALLKEANLTGSQVLINVTMERVQRLKGLYMPKEDNAVLVTGTVIEFLK